LLPLTDSVKPIVTENTEIGKLRLTAMKEGMRTLRLSGALKVAAGLTTIEEVLRVAPFTGTE
jgi:general secretion pathway protein E